MSDPSLAATLLPAGDADASAVALQAPPASPPEPAAYGPLLPGADAARLVASACPLAEAAGRPVHVVHDPGCGGGPNPRATRLTTDLHTGEPGAEVRGPALVLGASPPRWRELDAAVYEELLEYFRQGVRPREADVARLVADFRAGAFAWAAGGGGAADESGADEDANKDEG